MFHNQSKHANERANERHIAEYIGYATTVADMMNRGECKRADALVVMGYDKNDFSNPYIVAVVRYSPITKGYRVISTFKTNKISTAKHRVDQIIEIQA